MKDGIVELDVKGLPCPLPVVRLKKLLATLDSTVTMVHLEASDQGALKDIPAFCQIYGLECKLIQNQPFLFFEIRAKK